MLFIKLELALLLSFLINPTNVMWEKKLVIMKDLVLVLLRGQELMGRNIEMMLVALDMYNLCLVLELPFPIGIMNWKECSLFSLRLLFQVNHASNATMVPPP